MVRLHPSTLGDTSRIRELGNKARVVVYESTSSVTGSLPWVEACWGVVRVSDRPPPQLPAPSTSGSSVLVPEYVPASSPQETAAREQEVIASLKTLNEADTCRPLRVASSCPEHIGHEAPTQVIEASSASAWGTGVSGAAAWNWGAWGAAGAAGSGAGASGHEAPSASAWGTGVSGAAAWNWGAWGAAGAAGSGAGALGHEAPSASASGIGVSGAAVSGSAVWGAAASGTSTHGSAHQLPAVSLPPPAPAMSPPGPGKHDATMPPQVAPTRHARVPAQVNDPAQDDPSVNFEVLDYERWVDQAWTLIDLGGVLACLLACFSCYSQHHMSRGKPG